MPLGNTTYLQVPLMAESDNQKYLISNDGMQAVDDAINRILSVDTTSADVTLSETQLVGNVFFDCSGHSVPRTLFLPTTVGGAPAIAVNRGFYVRNAGTNTLTIAHVGTPGTTTVLSAGAAALIFANGTDIITVASAAVTEFVGLSDTPLDYASAASKNLRVNVAGDGVEFRDEPAVPTLGTVGQVLRVAAGGLVMEFADESAANPTLSAETDSFVVTNTHLSNAYVDANKATAMTVTVPSGLTGMVPLTVEAAGVGDVSFVAGGGVTINSFESKVTLNGQYASATLIPKGSDVYSLIGNLR